MLRGTHFELDAEFDHALMHAHCLGACTKGMHVNTRGLHATFLWLQTVHTCALAVQAALKGYALMRGLHACRLCMFVYQMRIRDCMHPQ